MIMLPHDLVKIDFKDPSLGDTLLGELYHRDSLTFTP